MWNLGWPIRGRPAKSVTHYAQQASVQGLRSLPVSKVRPCPPFLTLLLLLLLQVDVFEVEATIGDLKYIKIGHDNTGPGPGWHLQV